MKKILATVLLSTCLCASLSFGMDVPKESIPYNVDASIYKTYQSNLLKGFEDIDYDIISQYRKAFAQLEEEMDEFTYPTIVESMPFLVPLAHKALDYVQSLVETHPQVKIFEKEINYRLESEDVTPIWYHLLGLRIQAAISTVSPDELNLFNHVIEPGEAILKGLKMRDAWKSHEKSALLIDGFRKNQQPAHHISYTGLLDWEAVDDAFESLEKMLPAQIYWNLFNKKYTGIPFLVHSIINDIYAIALPKTGAPAHGIDLSSLSFSAHDFLHAENDQRRAALEQFVANEMVSQLEKGDVKLESVPAILDYAIKRYNLLNEALGHLFNCHLLNLKLNPQDEAEFKRSMTGFFWVLHEQVVFNPDIYKMNDFKDVLRSMADRHVVVKTPELSVPMSSTDSSNSTTLPATTETNVDYVSWESPHDFFTTSPIDGEPGETDEEIIRKTIEYVKSGSSQIPFVTKDTYVYTFGENPPASVKVSDRFIDVTLTALSGKKHRLSFPTLFHKWGNIDDSLNLLKYAGETIEKPNLEEIKPARAKRATAIETLGKVEKTLETMTSDFLNKSLELMDVKWLNESTESLTSHFQIRAESLEAEYQENLKALNITK